MNRKDVLIKVMNQKYVQKDLYKKNDKDTNMFIKYILDLDSKVNIENENKNKSYTNFVLLGIKTYEFDVDFDNFSLSDEDNDTILSGVSEYIKQYDIFGVYSNRLLIDTILNVAGYEHVYFYISFYVLGFLLKYRARLKYYSNNKQYTNIEIPTYSLVPVEKDYNLDKMYVTSNVLLIEISDINIEKEEICFDILYDYIVDKELGIDFILQDEENTKDNQIINL